MTDARAEARGDVPTIAVTGAAGYIGSRVVHHLAESHPDWSVRALDNFFLGDVRQIGDVPVNYVDVRDRKRLEEALDGADVVMHLAAISGVDDCDQDPDLAHEVNVTGTNNVAWFCRKTGASLVFPFSVSVLGDPERFPITVDQPRRPMNWYGQTKMLNERAIETYADDAFPAHLYMITNVYGEHTIGDKTVSKGSTVLDFFINRALASETLTVYEPGTQARNYVHVKDLAGAYVHSAERLLEEPEPEPGVRKFEIAGNDDPSVLEIAEWVREVTAEEAGIDVDVELVENPRAGEETLVEDFEVDTTRAHEELGWEATHGVEESVRELISRRA